jgi:uncharacterized protein YbbK (DUF523 family)
VYDGSFSSARHPGNGVTASLLIANGIDVFAPAEIDLLAKRLRGEALISA